MRSVKGIVPVSVELNGTLVVRRVIVIAYTPEGEWDVVAHGVSSTLGPVGFEVTVPEGSLVYSAQVDDWGRVFEPDLIVSVGEVIRPTVFDGYTYEVMQDGQLPAMEPGWWTTPSTQQIGSAALARRVHTAPTIEGPVQGVEWESAGDPHWDSVVSLYQFGGHFQNEKGGSLLPQGTIPFVEGWHGQALSFAGANNNTNKAWETPADSSSYLESVFTIEAVVYVPPGTTGTRVVLSSGANGQSGSGTNLHWWLNVNSTQVRLTVSINGTGGSTGSISSTDLEPLTGWVHVAVCRYANSSAIVFVDGEVVGTGTLPLPHARGVWGLCVGMLNYPAYRYPFIGDLDSVRVTKGVARYTEDFTPPTEPFPNFK